MKFCFSSSINNGTKCLDENLRKFHKNLFLDDFQPSFDAASSSCYCGDDPDNDEYIEDDEDLNKFEDEQKIEYINSIEENAKFFKLNHLSMPLTDTIAQFAQELSNDEFFINDLSFIFEMSRKRAISPYAIIVALLYLKRLKNKSSKTNENTFSYSNSTNKSTANPNIENNCLTNSELCLVSILLACKYLVDEGESNEIYNNDWANACDISIKKINQLERVFLKKMDWDLHVSNEEFWSFTKDLTESITRKKIKSQLNQCNYSDLDFLLRNSMEFSFDSIRKHLCLISKIIFVCSSTLIYITFSSFLVSTYLLYLKNQLVTNINLNSLSSTRSNRSSTSSSTSGLKDLISENNFYINNNRMITDNNMENAEQESFFLDLDANTTKNESNIQLNLPYCRYLNEQLQNIGVNFYKMFEIKKKKFSNEVPRHRNMLFLEGHNIKQLHFITSFQYEQKNFF